MVTAQNQSRPRFRAVVFDLLTALVDSWSFWIEIAGDDAQGRAWRRASLRRVTTTGSYRSYEAIVAEAAAETGLAGRHGDELIERWAQGGLRPWPEAPAVLAQLGTAGWRTAVVANCSQRLAEAAAQATGHRFDEIVSAERAGVYKTDPRAYRAGLAALGNPESAEILFVAGSAHDVPGAAAVGMPVYWSNRFADQVPPAAPPPLRNEPNLLALPALLAAGPLTRP